MLRLFAYPNQGAAANPSPPAGFYWKVIYIMAWIIEGSGTGTRTIAISQHPVSGHIWYIAPPLSSTVAVSGDYLQIVAGVDIYGNDPTAAASEYANWPEPLTVATASIYIGFGLITGDTSGFEMLVEEIPI
jgi:hypothetical protein